MYFNNDDYSNIRVVNVSSSGQTGYPVEEGRFMPGFPGGFPNGMGGFPGGSGMGSFPGQPTSPQTPIQQPSQPSQSGGQFMQPTSPAPNYIPEKPQKAAQGAGFTSYLVEAPSMVGCRGRWVYIWPTNGGPGYWLFLVYVGQRSIAGFLSNFTYFGIDTTYIDAFVCA